MRRLGASWSVVLGAVFVALPAAGRHFPRSSSVFQRPEDVFQRARSTRSPGTQLTLAAGNHQYQMKKTTLCRNTADPFRVSSLNLDTPAPGCLRTSAVLRTKVTKFLSLEVWEESGRGPGEVWRPLNILKLQFQIIKIRF